MLEPSNGSYNDYCKGVLLFTEVQDGIIPQTNDELKQLQSDLDQLKDVSATFQGILGSHTPLIAQAALHAAPAAEQIKAGTQELERCEQEKKKENRFTLFSAGGGVAGATLGTIGFLVNPLVGGVAMIALGLTGAGVGALASK